MSLIETGSSHETNGNVVAKAGLLSLLSGSRRLAWPQRSVPEPGLPDVLGRLGSLELRLARTRQDVWRAQRLRYKVFFGEMAATPSLAARLIRRDADAYDRHCDHLLVIDHAFRSTPASQPRSCVVGTYRLLRQDRAAATRGFYSEQEFDFSGFLAAHPGARSLELGRSCVLRPYRTRRTVELLWRGIWAYVRHHRIDLMFGCASLEGTDPEALAPQLSFLHHMARSPADWGVAALPFRYEPMNRLDVGHCDGKRVLASLPPLIKAYLRIGATIGDGAVIDRQFGTTDVFVMLRVADIEPRYTEYYA